MSAIGFKCPNGDKVKFEDCLARCDHRCMALPELKATGSLQQWYSKKA